MRWFSIYDVGTDDPQVVGLILEGEDGGIAGAVLEGDRSNPDSAYRVISDLAGEPINTVVPGGGGRIRVTVQPGSPGYVSTLLHAIRYPLAPGPRGHVSIGSPNDMMRRVWDMVTPESPIPPLVDLGPRGRTP